MCFLYFVLLVTMAAIERHPQAPHQQTPLRVLDRFLALPEILRSESLRGAALSVGGCEADIEGLEGGLGLCLPHSVSLCTLGHSRDPRIFVQPDPGRMGVLLAVGYPGESSKREVSLKN